MLGQPTTMLIPKVLGVKITGTLNDGVMATDLVLNITHILRHHGVVGKFVEFFGDGIDNLSLADRATIANMAPEYGATCGFFPIDDETINFLRLTNRDKQLVDLVKSYTMAQGLWRNPSITPQFNEVIEINLGSIPPTIAGPKRPQDKIALSDMKKVSMELSSRDQAFPVGKVEFNLKDHDVVIAAITSCTNTSNPYAMIGAGILARKARKFGIASKPWVKTSLAPGSQAVTQYLQQSGLLDDLNYVGFNIVGYGCTTCIGNSGPLADDISKVIIDNDMVVSSVLSGNRNFEGRIHPLVKANYLASPALVVAYALVGSTLDDIQTKVIGTQDGKEIFLKDIWPTDSDIQEIIRQFVIPDNFLKSYASIENGDDFWQKIKVEESERFNWDKNSTYIKNPPYFDKTMDVEHDAAGVGNICNARILAILGDSVTTDHISPAGNIRKESPSGQYLMSNGIEGNNFNSYGSRRGNHEVRMRMK
jgi:aconitate hydratase